jgi:hypothetical protein
MWEIPMRLLHAFLFATALTALGSGFAFAASNPSPGMSYDGCVCRFGYGTNGCIESVACGSSGGRCAQACKLPVGYNVR